MTSMAVYNMFTRCDTNNTSDKLSTGLLDGRLVQDFFKCAVKMVCNNNRNYLNKINPGLCEVNFSIKSVEALLKMASN